VTFTGQFANKCPIIYVFNVKLNKSEYILKLLDNIKMKRNLKLLLLMDTIAVYPITVWKDADIFKVTVATVLYKHLTNQMLLGQHNILKLYNHFQ
jgi:hypothetical protein